MQTIMPASTRNPRGLATIAGLVLAVTGVDVLVALGVQKQITQAKKISRDARLRVRPTNALPNGVPTATSTSASTTPRFAT